MDFLLRKKLENIYRENSHKIFEIFIPVKLSIKSSHHQQRNCHHASYSIPPSEGFKREKKEKSSYLLFHESLSWIN